MLPYFLFFDFDNTVYVNGRISDATLSSMIHAHEAGHQLILCTGRSEGHRSLLPELEYIPWDGMIFGGADIYYKGISYQKRVVDIADLAKWLQYATKYGYDLVLEGQKALTTFHLGFADQTAGKTIFGYREEDFQTRTIDSHALPDLKAVIEENPITKITIMKGNLDPSFFPKTEMQYIVHPNYMEAFAPGCDKGNAIRLFCRYLHISLEQCACFGDSMNDYSMFEVCPTSIAMKWAPEDLSAIATYTAKTSEGVSEGLAWLLEDKA